MSYLKVDYAKLKGVSPGRISQLIKRGLEIKKDKDGRERVVDCEANDKFFEKASWNSKRKGND